MQEVHVSVSTDTIQEIDLEELLDDSPECEARHEAPWPVECTQEAIAVFTSCTTRKLVCRRIIDKAMSVMSAGFIYCKECERLTGDCWNVRML